MKNPEDFFQIFELNSNFCEHFLYIPNVISQSRKENPKGKKEGKILGAPPRNRMAKSVDAGCTFAAPHHRTCKCVIGGSIQFSISPTRFLFFWFFEIHAEYFSFLNTWTFWKFMELFLNYVDIFQISEFFKIHEQIIH